MCITLFIVFPCNFVPMDIFKIIKTRCTCIFNDWYIPNIMSHIIIMKYRICSVKMKLNRKEDFWVCLYKNGKWEYMVRMDGSFCKYAEASFIYESIRRTGLTCQTTWQFADHFPLYPECCSLQTTPFLLSANCESPPWFRLRRSSLKKLETLNFCLFLRFLILG